MKAWFDALEERERNFVLAAAVIIVCALYWFGVWRPLDSGQASVATRVDNWRISLAELQPLKGRIQASGTAQQVSAGQTQSLVVIVANTVRQRGLNDALQRSQPAPSDNSIRVEFENASFDDLILWLGDVNQQDGLMVESGSFSPASGNNPGRVNASLTLER